MKSVFVGAASSRDPFAALPGRGSFGHIGMGSMYLRFFGFKDNPFKASPEREALFIGRHQEEALAHLRYALAEGEGFTVISGERGVGKTTVCREFLDRLEPSVSAAFLSGPVATPGELLRRTNAAFGIAADGTTLKGLIDPLNDFLMRRKMSGGKAAVFIDDAHALAPEVLEQIRLISNLETTREKLIQLVLIGEPGLLAILNSHALRQMGQRVSVRYELGPLSEAETARYIQHRVSVASQGGAVQFEPGALRVLHRYARGIPRSINTACEAALKAACGAAQKTVTVEVARAAVDELRRLEAEGGTRRIRRTALAWGAAACGLIALLAAVAFMRGPETGKAGVSPEPAAVQAQTASGSVVTKAVPEELDAEAAPSPVAAAPAAAAAEPEASPPAAVDQPAEVKTAAAAQPAATPPTHSVQVGAYLVPENAAKQAESLSARGYAAKIFEVVDSMGRRWHTVRIGDYPSREAARSQADAFTRREQVQCIVRPYGKF
jgi:general secretion pathway protein A